MKSNCSKCGKKRALKLVTGPNLHYKGKELCRPCTQAMKFAAATKQFAKDESGQDLVEYALIVAAVGLALISTLNLMTGALAGLYDSVAGKLTGIDWTEARR